MELAGKNIILTGAKRIGKTVARRLAEQGANLAIIYYSSREEADEIVDDAKNIGVDAVCYQADVSKEDDVESVVAQVSSHFERIDGLVHMASPYPKTPLGEITMETFDRVMRSIAGSSILLGQEISKKMSKNPGDVKGKIVFFSDWSVLKKPYKDYLVYNAAKASVNSVTKSLAVELAPHVSVNAIAPGPILPPPDLTDEENAEALSKTPLRKWGGADAIAEAVLYLLRSDFTTGVILPVDGGRSVA